MNKKIALILCGNLRTFFYNNSYIAKKYLEFVKKNNVDIFIYTDNNDFYYQNAQYFSEHNKNKICGIENDYIKRLHINSLFINYEESHKIIKNNLSDIFGNYIKSLNIKNFNNNLINKIYNKNNIYHNLFMKYEFSTQQRKNALMCQFYKLYKCFKKLKKYEDKNNIQYDIIVKSRFDLLILGLSDIDINNLDLNKKIYTNGYGIFFADTWAIGDKYIMEKYCNYFLCISPNILDNVYCYRNHNGWYVVKIENNILSDYRQNNNIIEDGSDSGEFGLTYLIKYKNNYEPCYNLKFDLKCFKFYDEYFYNYFKNLTS